VTPPSPIAPYQHDATGATGASVEQSPNARPRIPRDAQRRRVYLAETPLPVSPLPGLDACAGFMERVVGTLWWEQRFPDHNLGNVPRLRPGNGARQAFYREETGEATITLPRRYRTKGVVLHELVHWALGFSAGLPPHGRTFARVLVDATEQFCGVERADALAASYREHGVHVGKAARIGPDGRYRYGWDERLRLGRGRLVEVSHRIDDGPDDRTAMVTSGEFVGYARGSSIVQICRLDGVVSPVRASTIYDVQYAR